MWLSNHACMHKWSTRAQKESTCVAFQSCMHAQVEYTCTKGVNMCGFPIMHACTSGVHMHKWSTHAQVEYTCTSGVYTRAQKESIHNIIIILK